MSYRRPQRGRHPLTRIYKWLFDRNIFPFSKAWLQRSFSFFFRRRRSLDQRTPVHTVGLFIARSYDRKHIVPYFSGLVACSVCVVASFCVEAAVQALWMNRVSARGWEMALILLWCHSRNREKRMGALWDLPFILPSLLLPPLCPPPRFSCSVTGSYYRLVTHTTAPSSTQSPLTHPKYSFAISPCPALPSPALPVPGPQTLAPFVKIPISRPRSGAQAKKAANLVHVCVYLCVYICVSLTDPLTKVGFWGSEGTQPVNENPWSKYHRHTQQPVHYSCYGSRGVANQYLLTVHPD